VLIFTRWVMPAAIIVAGIVTLTFGTTQAIYGGCGLIAAGTSAWLISWVYRIGVRGDEDRDAEDRARRYFERFGRWPDE
jgi:hypothetical protein